MKKTVFKTKVIAMALSVVTACSVGTMAITSASAATINTGDHDIDIVLNADYQAGMGIIRQFIPGGQAIAGVIDSIFGSFMNKGPSLSDIRNDISDFRKEVAGFRKEVSKQFDEVKKELANIQGQLISLAKSNAEIKSAISKSESEIRADMQKQTQSIEQQIISQTVIANKGVSFDNLMTALKETDRQIGYINNDDTLSDQDKAVQIAMLIDRNNKWNSTDNLYYNYMSFLNTLTSSTFCSTSDHDIFYYIYQSNLPYALFTQDAKELSGPYIKRLMSLGIYAYSIIAECLKAAQTVAYFTSDDIAKLNEDNVSAYHQVKSLKSVVNGVLDDLNKKVFDVSDNDSIAAHLKNFNDINGHIFIKMQTVNIPLKATLILDTDHEYGNFYEDETAVDPESGAKMLNDLQNSSPLSQDDIRLFISYIGNLYPGESIADYLSKAGFDMTSLKTPYTVYLMTDSASASYYDDSILLTYYGIGIYDTGRKSWGVVSSEVSRSDSECSRRFGDAAMFFAAESC